ncbi:tetratricopeptide repeat protein [Wolbachia endosymbiont of Brugia malayi]|uniref:tetratricopeptide repeat protein n=1 Tax=Wolbachia endosymbiont of Brugia malayi TaxID=80849 RepID=UPI0005A2EE39|nr:tetratricopeptide repeat protein [Wolbachia endosymbiont of Brugia malayi]
MEKDYLVYLLILISHGYFSLGNPKKQQELPERALPIFEKYYGTDHFKVAIILANLGIVHRALGKHKKRSYLSRLYLSLRNIMTLIIQKLLNC